MATHKSDSSKQNNDQADDKNQLATEKSVQKDLKSNKTKTDFKEPLENNKIHK